MWSANSILPALVARCFAIRPLIPLWQWAEKNIFLTAKMAAEPGFYDSRKTPWTRRIQEIMQTGRDPRTGQRIRQITVKKSSVAGYTEAVLNAIRFFAKYDPRNVIYAIDSKEEAKNINTIRLTPTLRHPNIGEEIFTGDDDDVGKYMITLRHMIIWFFGSYSSGKFANKQAPFCVGDELEEHGSDSGDTSTSNNLRSRMKSAEAGMLVLLSKPKLKSGPITKEHADGNCEIWLVPCPQCGTYQELAWERIRFAHCKDLLGAWDKRRIQTETYYECVATYCHAHIAETQKEWMNDRGHWFATNANCTPDHISQQMSDLYGYNPDVTWPRLALKFIATKGDMIARQGFQNHNLGLEWEEEANKTEMSDVLACRAAYRRGRIPYIPVALILTSDIGLTYAKWEVAALAETGEAWVIDWGKELHPDDVLRLVLTKEYVCSENGEKYGITYGFMDGKYRKEEVYAACLRSSQRMWPVAGISADFALRSISFNRIPDKPKWFGVIVFVDRDVKHQLYVDQIKNRRPPGWHLPEDVTEDFVLEHTTEQLVEAAGAHAAKQFVWKRIGENHWGDCSKVALMAWRYLTKDRPPEEEESPLTPPSG
jgi:hypothetical protein